MDRQTDPFSTYVLLRNERLKLGICYDVFTTHVYFRRDSPPWAQGLLVHEVARSHTMT